MGDAVGELVATEVGLAKLGARQISAAEVSRVPRSRHAISATPWTDPAPAPGDFDADLDDLPPEFVVLQEGDSESKLSILVSVEGVDASRLARIAEVLGKTPGEVVAELIRAADRPAA
ncbi:MAG: hypothetical protein ABSH51_22710 [Solirubrobacteraceae bacterium]